MATTRMFNGSTLTFGTAIAKLTGINYTVGGVTVDVTEPDDLTKLFECGQDDLEVTAKVKRLPTIVRGDVNTLVATWADGSSDPLGDGKWVCTDVTGTADENGVISGTLKFKNTPTFP